MVSELSIAEMRRKSGHQEVLGETLAKFEFFMHGWHPYSRFLDVEKIDLILRRRTSSTVEYREVQVKIGKLYPMKAKWERKLFSITSWRFFSETYLDELSRHAGLFVSYVLAEDDGFKGDLFNFRVKHFVDCIRRSHRARKENYKVLISRSHDASPRWYMWSGERFDDIHQAAVIDVTDSYRNFSVLD